MKNRIKVTLFGIFCFFLLGCSGTSIELNSSDEIPVILEEGSTEEEFSSEETEVVREAVSENEQEAAEEEEIQAPEEEIAVHLCGAVKNPGVYEIDTSLRLFELIDLAGGFTEDAEEEYLNLAIHLEDGMQIRVPTKEEAEEIRIQNKEGAEGAATISLPYEETGKVNINTANQAELCTLPGIGETRAERILEYRNKQGPFKEIEDIMKVSGIKQAAFDKIKDSITCGK